MEGLRFELRSAVVVYVVSRLGIDRQARDVTRPKGSGPICNTTDVAKPEDILSFRTTSAYLVLSFNALFSPLDHDALPGCGKATH